MQKITLKLMRSILLVTCVSLVIPGHVQMSVSAEFLAPPGFITMYESIPDEVIKTFLSIDDLIAYIWKKNKEGIQPLGIHLESYPQTYGQFAIYYLIRDLRMQFQGLQYFRDPSPQLLGRRVNKIMQRKHFKTQYLTTEVFYHVKRFFGKMCREKRLEECKNLSGFLSIIESDLTLSKINLSQLTGAVGKRRKFAELLGVEINKIPEAWNIPYIDLTVKQLKAVRDLFKPKIEDGSISNYTSPAEFARDIEKDKILSKVSIKRMKIVIQNCEIFAGLMGVEEAVLSEQWRRCFGFTDKESVRAIATAL